ncbi:NAD(P)/FAD-dependent oxidoreductase, partial [Cribrihabitans sp. XS_ASV171]
MQLDPSRIRARSYWLEDLEEPPALPEQLPEAVEILIVGAGYTGLHAAIQTARGGRSTLVLEADAPGFGCSTRNGGQVSTSIKPSQEALAARHGAERARAIRQEGKTALQWIGEFVEAEGIDCDYRRSGRFHAAHTPWHYEELARDAEKLRRNEGIESFTVPRVDQRSELGTDCYFGGVVFPEHCALQPAKYHRGLLNLALASGAEIRGHCPALSVTREGSEFIVATPRGPVRAREVLVATNGYTGDATPWFRRRVIPIG